MFQDLVEFSFNELWAFATLKWQVKFTMILKKCYFSYKSMFNSNQQWWLRSRNKENLFQYETRYLQHLFTLQNFLY